MKKQELEYLKTMQRDYIDLKIKIQSEITKRNPKLYSYVNFFECGMGWFGLIKELSEKLEKLIENSCGDEGVPYALNVRERDGVLYFEMEFPTEEMAYLAEDYESLSANTCEICGEEGILQVIHNKYLTRCKIH